MTNRINSLLGDPTAIAFKALSLAESLYGVRVGNRRIIVVEHKDGPRIGYPTPDTISIALKDDLESRDQGLFQLYHEVVHLLAPGPNPAAMIEEGLAVKFSIEQPDYSANYREMIMAYLKTDPFCRNYIEAFNLTNDLIVEYPDAIVRLRQKEAHFHKMRPELLISELGIARERAERLCERREMR